ncbi:MAG: hypothetical protein V4677_16115 [Bacteroidota bacterium]
MAFTGNEAEQFPLNTAADWTRNYRNSIPAGETIAHFFGKNIINNILAQEGCMGIRIYYALDEQGKKQLIIVGADANENDIYNGIIAERSYLCPPFCTSDLSPLKNR